MSGRRMAWACGMAAALLLGLAMARVAPAGSGPVSPLSPEGRTYVVALGDASDAINIRIEWRPAVSWGWLASILFDCN